jgi:hypothetical protein
MTLPSTSFRSISCRAGKRMSTFVDCGVVAVVALVAAAINIIEAMAKAILMVLVL